MKKQFSKYFAPSLKDARKRIKEVKNVEFVIEDKYQGLGINSIIMLDVLKEAIKDGIVYAETGPELADNEKVQAQWKGFDARIVRRRRCWMKDIE